MILQQWLGRLRRVRLLLILVVVVLGLVVTVFDAPLAEVLAPTCDAPPAYHADVPGEVRAVVDTLFDNGLLYCAEPADAFDGLDGPLYWGSDGLSAWVFFQAADLAGVGLTRYVYGKDFTVGPPGDAPPPQYGTIGAPSRQNEAPTADPTYFFRRDGAPAEGDARVVLRVRGPAPPAGSGPGSRDVWRDLERLVGRVRGNDARAAAGMVSSEAFIAVRPARWADLVERRAAPDLADADGRPSVTRLAERPPGAPTVWQTVSGISGNTVWVAGVLTDTVPTLRLAAPGPAVAPLAPLASTLWTAGATGVPLAMFAFDPQPADVPLTARFWVDGRRADTAPPDAEWAVTFP